MLALTLEKLVVRYPSLPVPALDIPTLTLAAGTRIALTGPSGSGKTTFINCVTGMERAEAGKILWNDTDLAALSENDRDRWRARNVGLIMQDFHLFPGLSAAANVLLPMRLSGRRLAPDAQQQALELLTKVGLTHPDQPVETLSRGQMQRVAVARALLGKPGLIVADEPTASLDAEAGIAVAELLFDLSRDAGATLLVATHDPRLMTCFDCVLRLENGHLEPHALGSGTKSGADAPAPTRLARQIRPTGAKNKLEQITNG